ncbi:MAG: hypothetical protein WB608_02630 [Terracidiphilus sp.]
MKIREFGVLALATIAGLLSAVVTLGGLYSVYGLDFRRDTVLSVLYCLLPILCFPVFILVRPAQRSAAIAAVLAVAYLVVYSMLNWRTCAEYGYCGSVASAVMETLKTRTTSCYFGVALFSFAAVNVDRHAKQAKSQHFTRADSA